MKNKKKYLILFTALTAAFLFASCSNDKYMLSGTWYEAQAEPVKWVFYENGKVTSGEAEGAYEMLNETELHISIEGQFFGKIDKDVKTITISAGGTEKLLFKSYSEAKKLGGAAANENADKAEELLEGTWVSDNNVKAVFEGDTLTMVTAPAGDEPISTSYKVSFEKGKIQLISGNEVVDEFSYVMKGDKLTFENDDVTIQYTRK